MHYRTIEMHEIDRSLFEGSIRHQKVVLCRRRKNDAWVIEPDPFIGALYLSTHSAVETRSL